jgi:hypothetical protein
MLRTLPPLLEPKPEPKPEKPVAATSAGMFFEMLFINRQ